MSAGDGPLIVSNTVLSALWGVLTAQLISLAISSSSWKNTHRNRRQVPKGGKEKNGRDRRAYNKPRRKGDLFTDEDEDYDDEMAGEDVNPWKREFYPPQMRMSLKREHEKQRLHLRNHIRAHSRNRNQSSKSIDPSSLLSVSSPLTPYPPTSTSATNSPTDSFPLPLHFQAQHRPETLSQSQVQTQARRLATTDSHNTRLRLKWDRILLPIRVLFSFSRRSTQSLSLLPTLLKLSATIIYVLVTLQTALSTTVLWRDAAAGSQGTEIESTHRWSGQIVADCVGPIGAYFLAYRLQRTRSLLTIVLTPFMIGVML